MANILIFGDSNTHGTVPLVALGQSERFPAAVRWPDVMAAATGHNVIAEGLPGRTTVHDDPVEGGARNGAAVLPAVVLSHTPLDLVVIMLGTNDLKPRFATSAFDIAKSVARLVQITRSCLPDVAMVLIAPAPVVETGVLADTFAGAEARQIGLDAHLEAVARQAGVRFLRAGDHVAVSAVDGVHLDAAGHLAFGGVMATFVAEVVGAAPNPTDKISAPDPNTPAPNTPEPPVTLERLVPPEWVDYNGHMNEAHYLAVFSDATDQMLDWAGMDTDCVAQGFSVFTVETHIRHLGEVNIGGRVCVRTRVIDGGGKKLHLWHELRVGGQLCATGEQLLLHMDLTTRKSAPPRADVAAWLAAAKAAHAPLPLPEGLGRYVAQQN